MKYPMETLRWALCPPNYRKHWHIGVVNNEQKLIGMITAVPNLVQIYGKEVKLVEINFLCIRSSYRHKNLAPILIKEISRRVGLEEIWAAMYTSSLVLPHMVSKTHYYHRPLNFQKLMSLGFSRKHPKLTMKGSVKYYELPKICQTNGLRKMEERDISQACTLLNNHLKRFDITTQFDEVRFAQRFCPVQNDVVHSYVVRNSKGDVVSFASFYTLEISFLTPNQGQIKSAHLLYLVEGDSPNFATDILILAKQLGYDVFTCLDVGDNSNFFQKGKFSQGNGRSQYYLHNWRCPETKPNRIAVVLP
jgi:glycylpeptide N-tetradecanoyltransferase